MHHTFVVSRKFRDQRREHLEMLAFNEFVEAWNYMKNSPDYPYDDEAKYRVSLRCNDNSILIGTFIRVGKELMCITEAELKNYGWE